MVAVVVIIAAVIVTNSRQKESVESNHPAEARTASAVVLEKDLRIGTGRLKRASKRKAYDFVPSSLNAIPLVRFHPVCLPENLLWRWWHAAPEVDNTSPPVNI